MLKTLVLFLVIFYGLAYFALIKKHPPHSSPELKERLGTTLFTPTSTDRQVANSSGATHIYCYYPTAHATYQGKSGEYIIKKVSQVTDCTDDWMGTAILSGAKGSSEREMISWASNILPNSPF